MCYYGIMMMEMNMANGYNGWTNKATWLVNLWMGDYFQSCVDDGQDVDADFIEASIEDMLADEMNSQSSLIADFVNMCLAEVNWRELARFYQPMVEPEADIYGDNALEHEF